MLELNWGYILKKGVVESYDKNELAFLALQGKIELQLRDKIAWYIEKQYSKDYLVKREFGPSGREKCDLAILKKDTKSPVCLIEFKAHSSAKFENHYATKECVHDCKKMIKISEDTRADTNLQMLFIFFQTHHKGEMNDDYNGIIAYYDTVRKGLDEKVDGSWKQFDNCGDREDRVDIDAGKYYGLEVKVATMILKVNKEKVSKIPDENL